MTLKIYGVLRSRASRNVWLARELGIPYELVPVIQAYRLADPLAAAAPLNTRSPAFLAINPNAQIPCIDDSGFVLCESLAINLYLAQKHGGPLAPQDDREHALMTMWALWAGAGCEAHALAILDQRVRLPEPQRDQRALATAIAALRRPFEALEQTLASGGGFLVGRRFTAADINTAEVLRYAQPAPEAFSDFPAVTAWLRTCQSRPVFVTMMAEREKEPA